MPQCRTPILPSSPCLSETDWSDFPNAGTLLFQERRASAPAEHFLQRKSRHSRVSSLRTKRWHLWQSVCSGPGTNSALLFSSRSQPRSGCRLVLQCLAAASLVSAEGGVVPWTVLLRKCALGWTNEQRATAEFADGAFVSSVGIRRQAMPGPAVMPQSARRWNGLLPPRAVLLCSPGSLATVSAATCGPKLALPHNDRFDGRHFCGAGAAWPPLQDTRGVRSLCFSVEETCESTV